ncbi:hypothetical protein E8E14_005318 [Neopestalotiopsis sp. 37M]|nr:hypothetical protein E8E14_005318 [Neopestalotiopsis sp. 37M]
MVYLTNVVQNPTNTSGLNSIKCIWIPAQTEVRILIRKYINDISFLCHVLHVPSLPGTIDVIYAQIASQDVVQPGAVTLLLCIIASVTSQWTYRDVKEKGLFDTPAAASQQTSQWVKLALDVMDHSRRNCKLSLEHVQALVIGACVLCNLEGFASNFRGLLSMAVDIARELGFHSNDRRSNTFTREHGSDAVEIEMQRRVWWYLTATDWILSCHGGPLEGTYSINPRHMTSKRPRNVNDEDITCAQNEVAEHIANPTAMTYCLLRIRYAEICRAYTDRVPLDNSLPEEARYREVLELNHRLDDFMQHSPVHFRRLGTDIAKLGSSPSFAPQAFTIQRYLLTLNVYSLICRLHFPYFARATVQSTFSASRGACLDAARNILYAEIELSKETFPFVESRLRFSSILYGILVASTVFVVDMCLTPSLRRDAAYVTEASKAFEILQGASADSFLAAKVHQSLARLLEKHNVHIPPGPGPSTATLPGNNVSTTFRESLPFPANTAHIHNNFGVDASGRSCQYTRDFWNNVDCGMGMDDFEFSQFADECSFFM